VGIVDPVSGIDPHAVREFAGTMIARQVFEPLCRLGADGLVTARLLQGLPKLAPGSASTYTADLRPGLRFSDGTPVTAEHVVASLRRCGRLGDEARLSGRERTISIQLARPRASLPRELASWYASLVLPQGGELHGTGPYVCGPIEADGTLRLQPNPHHDGARAKITSIVVRAFRGSERGGTDALIDALAAGEIDFTSSLSRDDVDRLGHVRKRFAPASSTAVLWLNTERLPDLRLREAIVAAIDRHALAGAAGTVTSFVARGIVPPPLGRWSDGIRHRPDNARSLLQSIGARVQPLRMCVVWGPRRYLPDPLGTASRLAAQLGAVGLQVEIRPTTSSEDYMERWKSGDYDLLLGGWNADSTDPIELVRAFFETSAIHGRDDSPSHGCNLSRWSDARTDELLDDAATSGDPSRLDAVLAHVDRQALLVPLFHGAVVLAFGPRVRAIATDELGFPTFADTQMQS
jgi:peptide/nickel transport system substrate-binding protein